MITACVWIACLILGFLIWDTVTAEKPRPTVRTLTSDEQAAWGQYRIQDAAEVARRKHTREYDRRLWEVNLAHARAVLVWRSHRVRFCAWMDENEAVS